jgi:hypothetical protein
MKVGGKILDGQQVIVYVNVRTPNLHVVFLVVRAPEPFPMPYHE